jgi:hypothetical protein
MSCDYCHGVGACPKCWGREGYDELRGLLMTAQDLINEGLAEKKSYDWKYRAQSFVNTITKKFTTKEEK